MSIRTRLTVLFGLFFVLLLALAGFAIVQVNSMRQISTSLDVRWLPGTGELGEVADSLSEFRLAETYRVLADNPVAKAAAEAMGGRLTVSSRLGEGSAFTLHFPAVKQTSPVEAEGSTFTKSPKARKRRI